MGEIHQTEKACLLVGVLCNSGDVLTEDFETLKEFGLPALTSPLIPFDFTEYYTESMGKPLFRRFYLFQPGFDIQRLADIKIRTNALEKEAARDRDLGVARPLNLDPGYLTLSKLVLASTKDFSHRLYLRDGIYAEVTLHYRKKTYQPWPWTFPDFRSERYIAFFNEARAKLLR